ncbi:MAG: PTS sugar transporter subunit IIC, partial [Christensenellaceae bacterium]
MSETLSPNKRSVKYWLNRYFVQGMSAMALGLFSSLIIGLIISQIGKIPGLNFLTEITEVLSASSPVVGAAIGVAISWGLKAKPLVIFASAATGAYGYALGGPVGAFVGATVGSEIGQLVAGKTPVDIIVTPFVTIISGGIISLLIGGYVNDFMTWLGGVINSATALAPLPMGIVVSVIVGMALTAPISSAALCIM